MIAGRRSEEGRRVRDMRKLIVLALMAVLGGCGIAQRAALEERFETAQTEMAAAKAECDQRYPPPRKGQQAAWATCMNTAERPILAFVPYPDLVELKFANRLAMAAKMDRGAITYEDALLESARLNSQVVSEYERRVTASRAVSAQESAAAAQGVAASAAASAAYKASLGVTCTRLGNTTTCN
jgi:hypothetical protein